MQFGNDLIISYIILLKYFQWMQFNEFMKELLLIHRLYKTKGQTTISYNCSWDNSSQIYQPIKLCHLSYPPTNPNYFQALLINPPIHPFSYLLWNDCQIIHKNYYFGMRTCLLHQSFIHHMAIFFLS